MRLKAAVSELSGGGAVAADRAGLLVLADRDDQVDPAD